MTDNAKASLMIESEPEEVGSLLKLEAESEYIEHKGTTAELKAGADSVASILNKHGRGVLWFGTLSDGTVIGQDVNDKTLRKVSQVIRERVSPSFDLSVDKAVFDGRTCVKVEFSGDNAPYASNKVFYIRVADEDTKMDPDQVRSMIRRQEDERDPWDERPSRRDISDVDEPTLRAYVKRGNDAGRISLEFTDVGDVLQRLGLMAGERMTNAADVLFCPSRDVQLKMGVLATHARAEILDLQQEEGTVFDLVRKAELYVLNNTRRRFVKKVGPRDEIPEIPRDAVHEALMNAYTHRDWASGSCVQVDIFYDAVEIFSPGWFIEGQNPQSHLSGANTSSDTRNRLIARTLYRSKDIESYGTGIPNIRDLCDAAGVRVEYRKMANGTTLVFHRNDAFAGADAAGIAPSESAKPAPDGENLRRKPAPDGENPRRKPAPDDSNGKVDDAAPVTFPSENRADSSFEGMLARSGLAPVARRKAIMVYSAVNGISSFTWRDVSAATSLARRSSQDLLRKMGEAGLVVRVPEHGRGAYRFASARTPFEG